MARKKNRQRQSANSTSARNPSPTETRSGKGLSSAAQTPAPAETRAKVGISLPADKPATARRLPPWLWYQQGRRFKVAVTVVVALAVGLAFVAQMVGIKVLAARIMGPESGPWAYAALTEGRNPPWLPVPEDYHGVWRAWYPEGALWFEGTFAGGLPIGTHRFFRPDGTVRDEFVFTDAEGVAVTMPRFPGKDWSPDPATTKRPEGLGGTWRIYAEDGTTPRYEGLFRDGRAVGIHQTWLPDGTRIVSSQVNGLSDGETRVFYPDGALQTVIPYVAGKREGTITARYPDGQMMFTEQYRDNQKQGERREWAESGKLRLVERYQDDRLEGLSIRYDDAGMAMREGSYRAGMREGRWVEWFPGVSPKTAQTEMHYVNDLLDGPYRRWGKPGLQELEIQYKRGEREGLTTEFDDQGRRLREIPYVAGQRQGQMKEYRSDGSMSALVPFVNDRESGLGVACDGEGIPVAWHIYHDGVLRQTLDHPPESESESGSESGSESDHGRENDAPAAPAVSTGVVNVPEPPVKE